MLRSKFKMIDLVTDKLLIVPIYRMEVFLTILKKTHQSDSIVLYLISYIQQTI